MSHRLLFHYPVLHTGGAERSILRLTAALAERGCEVHLVLTASGGSLEPEVHPLVKLHHLRSVRMLQVPGSRGGQVLAAPVRALAWLASRLQEAVRRRRFRGVKFDAAFAGLAGLSPDFICNAVDARRRFVFVRNDPAVDSTGKWRRRIRAYHRRIDGYICVSEFVRNAMAKCFPEVSEKLTTIYNLIDAQAMVRQADGRSDPFPQDGALVRVLTVCRLNERAKALVRMVEVHRRLLDEGARHAWHVLGDGPDRGIVERAIAAHGVGDTFRLHGSVSNPFPYYKHADICAVLSRYEGLCGVVNEARVMKRPVIATHFSGVEEQIEQGINGIIVEQNLDSICGGLRQLIEDPSLRERIACGGYPDVLMDDKAKLDKLFRIALT